jgi:hypothetical protein
MGLMRMPRTAAPTLMPRTTALSQMLKTRTTTTYPDHNDTSQSILMPELLWKMFPAHCTPLHTAIDPECKDIEPENTDANEGDEGPTKLNHGRRQTRHHTAAVYLQYRISTASAIHCVWIREDWSSSYDAISIALWSLSEQSSEGWRSDLINCAPNRNVPLGGNLNHLTTLEDTRVSIEDRVKWSCRYRDRLWQEKGETWESRNERGDAISKPSLQI